MKILVTGANGQLGQQLMSMVDYWPEVVFSFKDSKELDISDMKSVGANLNNKDIDFVFNFAAFTQVDLAEEKIQKAFDINSIAVKNLSQICLLNGITLVHISTDFVFDGEKNTPYLVDDIPRPINVYGASKLQGEQYLQSTLPQHYIIRTSWLYSDFGNNFRKTMLKLAQNHSEVNVVNDQIGCPTHAHDLCEFIMNLVQNNFDYGLYHFSGELICSWYEFACVIFKENNIDIQVNAIDSSQFQSAAKRPRYSVIK